MMKKLVTGTLIAGFSIVGFVSNASAGKPESPGCFGQVRAADVENIRSQGTAPGASDWGGIASDSAGTNGTQNQAQKTDCGGDPTR